MVTNVKRKESPMKTTDSHELTEEESLLVSVLAMALLNAHNVAVNAKDVREKH
jgi:hypothetical protein